MSQDVIWQSVLDGVWDCRVTRIDGSRGLLAVTKVRAGLSESPLLVETVPLAYGATFGPDVSDVAEWQDKCAAAVDKAAS